MQDEARKEHRRKKRESRAFALWRRLYRRRWLRQYVENGTLVREGSTRVIGTDELFMDLIGTCSAGARAGKGGRGGVVRVAAPHERLREGGTEPATPAGRRWHRTPAHVARFCSRLAAASTHTRPLVHALLFSCFCFCLAIAWAQWSRVPLPLARCCASRPTPTTATWKSLRCCLLRCGASGGMQVRLAVGGGRRGRVGEERWGASAGAARALSPVERCGRLLVAACWCRVRALHVLCGVR